MDDVFPFRWVRGVAVAMLLSLPATPAVSQVVSLTGDFNGDDLADQLAIEGNGVGWIVTLAGQSTGTNWLPGWGPGSRNHVGDFDGDGRDDVLIFVPGQGWHLLLSTGFAFSPRLDTNPGFGPGSRECAIEYDGDRAAELIVEGDIGNGTCWHYDPAVSRFAWKTCSRVCHAPEPFFFVEDGVLYHDLGSFDQPHFIRGTSYLGCRGVDPYAIADGGIERQTWALFHYRDCGPHQILGDWVELRDRLGVNTIKILTPARAHEYPNLWEPWYDEDGALSAFARGKLETLFDVARTVGVELTLVLQLHYSNYPNALPGSREEAFWLRYMESLGAAFRDEPALLSYELVSEGLIRCPPEGRCNWGQKDGWEAFALSFHTRMARALKAADGNHLITSGQVSAPVLPGAPPWHFPSAEFALIDDIHGLNAGSPFNLYSQIDYLAPHLYASNIPPIVTPEQITATVPHLRAHRDAEGVAKPITVSEAGFWFDLLGIAGQPGAPTANELEQARYFSLLTAALDTAGGQGLLVWDAAPQLPLVPGSYTKTLNDFGLVSLHLLSPPHPRPREVVLLNGDLWNVFYWDFADRPAAAILRSYFASHP